MSSSSSQQPLCLVRSSINIDDFYAVASIVRPGQTISSSGLSSRAGGKGANVSAAIALAGARVVLVGAVGTEATWPVEELKKRGVQTQSVEVLSDGTPTGRAVIQIADDGENSIVLLKGANYHISPSLSDPAKVFASLPSAPTHVVLQNEIPLEQTKAFLAYANEQGCTTVFNPSPMPTKEELRAFNWSQLDVLIVNEGEALDLLSALGDASASEEAGAEKILEQLDATKGFEKLRWLVMTRGASGVLAKVKDTTGAGDTFAGNLVAALMRAEQGKQPDVTTQEVDEVLRWAGQAAALAVEVDGAMESIPKRDYVEARLQGQK